MLTVVGAVRAGAQDPCSGAVDAATRAYDDGRLADVIAIITPCDEMTREQRWQAYRLLALAHLFEDRRDSALEAVHRMLEINPHYEINVSRDPIEFVRLVEEFDIVPRFSVAFRAGVARSSRAVSVVHRIAEADEIETKSRTSIGTDVAVGIGYNVSATIGIGAELSYSSRSYALDQTVRDRLTTSYDEQLSYVSVPALASYRLRIGDVYATVSAGYFAQFLLAASSDVSGQPFVDSLGSFSALGIRSTIDRRHAVNHGPVVAFGASHAVGPGSVSVELRYEHGLADIVRPDERYDDDALTYRYLYADSDFRLRSLVASLTYVYSLSFSAVR